jgi:hypothetical protein
MTAALQRALVHGPVGREVEALVPAVEALVSAPVTVELCSGEIAVLTVLRAQLDAALLDRIGAVDSSLTWSGDGSRSAAAWTATRTHESLTQTRKHVRLRRRLQDRPLVDAALREGRISRRHASELCHWLGTLRDYLIGTDLYADLPALLQEQEAAFLRAALSTDPHTLAVELRKRVQAFAPEPAQRDADRVHDERTASLSPGFDGGFDLTASLGEHGGQVLAAALAAFRSGDQTAGDPRTPGQRQADALVGLAEHYLASGDAPLDRGVAPHVLVHVPLERWEAHLRHQKQLAEAGGAGGSRAGGSTGSAHRQDPFRDPLLPLPFDPPFGPPGTAPRGAAPPDSAPPDVAPPEIGPPATSPSRWGDVVPVATYADGRPVPERDLARELCDARITRVVMSPDGVPLELGRTQRLYTWHQTQAAKIRYQGSCAVAGCTSTPMLKMHHPTPWAEGGRTDNDAVPLCLHHHTWLHDGHSLQLSTGATLGPHGWITATTAA